MQGSKVPLKVGGESERIRCKTELVRITSQISVGIAPPYLTWIKSEFVKSGEVSLCKLGQVVFVFAIPGYILECN